MEKQTPVEDDLKVKEVESANEGETLMKDNSSHKEEDKDSEYDEKAELMDDDLDQVPPDFKWAEVHRDANRVKNIVEDQEDGQMYDDEGDFCK